jgi:hypothetical protein
VIVSDGHVDPDDPSVTHRVELCDSRTRRVKGYQVSGFRDPGMPATDYPYDV